MTVKVYVDWESHEILTEEEYNKKLRTGALTIMENTEEFNDWLESYYLPQNIWHLTEAGRAEVLTRWEAYCRDYAEEQMDYEETLINV
jgi:hypothetical protein